MARTHYVKAFRGQRKCQYVVDDSGWSTKRCGLNREAHEAVEYTDRALGHPFTQAPLKCGYCGEPINIGDPYKWVAPRAYRGDRGVKKVRHSSCPAWRQSELTSSPHLATMYAAQESAEDAIDALTAPESSVDVDGFLDELTAIVQEAAEGVREAAESYRESAQNIEDGFGHATWQSEELNEKADSIDGWADDMTYATFDNDFEEDLDCDQCGVDEDDDVHQDPSHIDYHMFEENEEHIAEWADDKRDEARELVGDTPL